jgi:hypothetical protein
MKFWLIILRIISGIQLLVAVFKGFTSLTSFLTGWEFIYLFQAIAFGLIAILPVQVFLILANNYPDKIIDGKQKRSFNRIFLVNYYISMTMLIFQFIILFGLFWLRSHIYHNVMETQFDFEAEDGKV